MSLDIYTYQLSLTDSSNMYISLDATPVSSANVALDMIYGTAQAINSDFRVDGTKIAWDSPAYNLYSQIATGDIVRVIYDRS